MKPLFISILILLSGITSAQWVQQTSNTQWDLYGVHFLNQNVGYSGGYDLIKTYDGGNTWTQVVFTGTTGTYLGGNTHYAVKMFSPSKIISAGENFFDDNESIILSNDSGNTWSIVHSGSFSSGLRGMFFINSSTGFVVGEKGRILKTVNGGNSWNSIVTGITKDLYDIHFIDQNIGFAVGDETILSSNDGGNTWIIAHNVSSINFRKIAASSLTSWFVTGESGVFLKTDNGGLSWSTYNGLPSNITYTAINFINNDTAFVTGNGFMYRTYDGGQYWEKTNIGQIGVNCISTSGNLRGYVVGSSGKIYASTNIYDNYYPVSSFITGSSVYCKDSLIQLINLSNPSNSFQWKINNQYVSNNYNYNFTITNGNQSDTITLITEKNGLSDTLHQTIYIQPSLNITFQYAFNPSNYCSGQNNTISIINSELFTAYQLQKNGSNVGSPKSGTGGTFNFNQTTISRNDSIRVIATKVIQGCGTTIDTIDLSISFNEPNINTLVLSSRDTICKGDSINIYIPLSETNVTYDLRIGTQSLFGPIQGNGDTLFFPIQNVDSTTTFNIRAVKSGGCAVILNHTITVNVEWTIPLFTTPSYINELSDSIDFINNTNNYFNSFMWDFGANAFPAISVSRTPSKVIYSTTGTKKIKLYSYTSIGCVDSLVKELKIIPYSAQDSCVYSRYSSRTNNGQAVAIKRDSNNNSYVLSHMESLTHEYVSLSENKDSINVNYPTNLNFESIYFLTKYNSKGIPQWVSYFRSESDFSKLGSLEIDSFGNIYCSYFFGHHGKNLEIHSTDGSVFKDVPPNGISTYSVIVTKFDNNGVLQWYNTYQDTHLTDANKLILSKDGELYACSRTKLCRFNLSGQKLREIQGGFFSDFVVDNNFLWCVSSVNYNLIITKYDTSGNVIQVVPTPIVTGRYTTDFEQAKIQLDRNKNVYLIFDFRGEFIFNVDTLYDNNSSLARDFAICKYDSSGNQLWAKQIINNSRTTIRGFSYKEDNLYFLTDVPISTSPSTIIYSLDTLSFSFMGQYFAIFDTAGNLSLYKIIENSSNIGAPLFQASQLFDLSKNSDNISITFPFNKPFYYSGKLISPYKPVINSNNNFVVLNGNLSCLLSGETNIPVSACSASSPRCAENYVNFISSSTGQPTSLLWSFAGGTPSTSTIANPTVYFNNPGIYQYSLTATNNYGSSIYYDSIIISSKPIISLTNSPLQINCSSEIYANISDGSIPIAYNWSRNNYTNTSNYYSDTLSNICQGNYNLTVIDNNGCSDTASITANLNLSLVWPGDANDDLTANNNDLLNVGLYYGISGTTRDSVSNLWLGYNSLNWNDTMYNGSNLNHADCNGDGIINDADTLAINLNYGLTHVRTGNMQSRVGEPLITLVPNKSTYLPGDTVIIDMVLGDANNPVANLYGMAFDISFDNSVAETGTVQLTYPNSFLGNISDNLKISKLFEQNGKADGAITRKNQQNANGYGTIATLQFIAKNNTSLPVNSSANVSGYLALTATADSVIFDTQSSTASFTVDAVTGIKVAENQFQLTAYPNPFTQSTTIQYILASAANTTLKVYDVLGKALMQTQNTHQLQGTHQIQFENTSNGKGIYIIELTVNGSKTLKRIVQVE